VKNKKLFAILTLVCFMFTLMPVAAFAADSYDADQVYVKANGATFETEDEATVKAPFAVRVGDGTTTSYLYYAVDEDGTGVAISEDGNMTINAIGTYNVYAINVAGADVSSVMNAIDTVANKVAKLVAWAESLDLIVAGEAEVEVVSPDMEYQIVLKAYTKDGYTTSLTGEGTSTAAMDIEASDGWVKNGKVIAELQSRVKNSGNAYAAVKAGYDLTISEAGYVDVAYDTLTTDRKGQVVFEVTADLANTGNKVIVKFGKAKAELTVDAASAGVANVVVNNVPKAPANNENAVLAANVEFKFTDANGVAANLGTTPYQVTLVEKPAKSNMKSTDFAIRQLSNIPNFVDDATGIYTLVCTDSDGKVDKDGTYTIKVALKNGSYATASFTVAEMGDVVRVMFKDAPKTVAYGETVNMGSVIAMDANGVATVVDAELSANGVAVAEFYAADAAAPSTNVKGDLVAKNDDKYIGSKITVMAVYDDEFIATTEVEVVDKAATIELVSDEAEVGINTTLEAKIIDASGAKTSIGTLADVKVIVLDKPENAIAVAAPLSTTALNDKGNVEISFLASAAGEYKLQVIVVTADNTYVSGIVTVTVGGGKNAFKDVVVVSMGANSMIVNNELVALDVAPFIENNRTMMQFNVLYVFGIDVEWVAETQSIVAEGNGLKVVMQLGSKVATVNGAEVALDVAPYSVNGRTVVPVGFITGLLDITPTFTYNADGTIADILFTK